MWLFERIQFLRALDRTCMYVCVRIYLDMCVHTREDGTMYNLIYWYLHVKCGTKRIENVTRYFNISIYIYVPNTSISVCIRTFACMYFAVCKCIYTQSVCVFIYIYIYIYIYICTFSYWYMYVLDYELCMELKITKTFVQQLSKSAFFSLLSKINQNHFSAGIVCSYFEKDEW